VIIKDYMKLSTVFIIAGMVIISLYFMVEVGYYATTQNVVLNKSDTPYLEIPKIDINQNINNKSIDYGVFHEPKSSKPGYGTVVLAGHRTFYSSPFLNLDKLQKGDKITVSWPGIGNVQYEVVKTYIVPGSYQLSLEQGKTLILYTCYPLGSSKQRLIIQAAQTKITPFRYSSAANTGDQSSPIPYALLLIGAFLAMGLTLSYLYPVKEDKIFIFMATITLTLFLLYGYLFPVPQDQIASQITNLSNLFGD
jgi:sortase A